jgi:hypothetical protein
MEEFWEGEVQAIHATEKALLVVFEGDQYWIPQKMIHDNSEVWRNGDEGLLVIPQWLAEEKGMC